MAKKIDYRGLDYAPFEYKPSTDTTLEPLMQQKRDIMQRRSEVASNATPDLLTSLVNTGIAGLQANDAHNEISSRDNINRLLGIWNGTPVQSQIPTFQQLFQENKSRLNSEYANHIKAQLDGLDAEREQTKEMYGDELANRKARAEDEANQFSQYSKDRDAKLKEQDKLFDVDKFNAGEENKEAQNLRDLEIKRQQAQISQQVANDNNAYHMGLLSLGKEKLNTNTSTNTTALLRGETAYRKADDQALTTTQMVNQIRRHIANGGTLENLPFSTFKEIALASAKLSGAKPSTGQHVNAIINNANGVLTPTDRNNIWKSLKGDLPTTGGRSNQLSVFLDIAEVGKEEAVNSAIKSAVAVANRKIKNPEERRQFLLSELEKYEVPGAEELIYEKDGRLQTTPVRKYFNELSSFKKAGKVKGQDPESRYAKFKLSQWESRAGDTGAKEMSALDKLKAGKK